MKKKHAETLPQYLQISLLGLMTFVLFSILMLKHIQLTPISSPKLEIHETKISQSKVFLSQLNIFSQHQDLPLDIELKNDVLNIHFKDIYFENGKDHLSTEAKNKLKKIIPILSQFFFSTEWKDKIQFIRIIGQASPTFQKKYLKLNQLNSQALKGSLFNLNLSYKRARSVFEFLFDREELSFPHQQTLRNLILVSGNGHFLERPDILPEGTHWLKYCQKVDCEKDQRIKFEIGLVHE